MNALENLPTFLRQSDHHKIFFRPSKPCDEAIMVEPSFRRAARVEPSFRRAARVEPSFRRAAGTEIEIFGPTSGVIGEASLERLWMQFSDAE